LQETSRTAANGRTDEFGSYSKPVYSSSSNIVAKSVGGNGAIPRIAEVPETSTFTGDQESNSAGGQTQGSNGVPRPTNRYTVANADETSGGSGSYLSALEEKELIRQRMEEERTQQVDAAAELGSGSGSKPTPTAPSGGRQLRKGWLSTEEEKRKQQLQQERYAQAKRTAEEIQKAEIARIAASTVSLDFLDGHALAQR
jgi:hypothetical protein